MPKKGTTSGAARIGSGPELLVELDRAARAPLRAQLEDGLREAVRTGRLPAHARLPATRALASDLGISRRLVVDVYTQLLAEGYLVARRGSGTFVADAAGAVSAPAVEPERGTPAFDFFPGNPDLATFPRGAWLRVLRETLREAPDRAFGYPDARGARGAAAGALRAPATRARRGCRPRSIVVCAGAAQGFALLAQAIGGGRIAVEDPGLPPHRAILAAHGASLVALPVDAQGARVQELNRPDGSRGRDRRGAGDARAPVAHGRRPRAAAPRGAAGVGGRDRADW